MQLLFAALAEGWEKKVIKTVEISARQIVRTLVLTKLRITRE
jgi:hypothetical protein